MHPRKLSGRASVVGVLCVIQLGSMTSCKSEDTSKPSPVQPSAAVQATVSAPAGTPASSVVASAPAAPSASAAPYVLKPSPRPTPKEWCKGELYERGAWNTIDGESFYPCALQVVREWVAVECPQVLDGGGPTDARWVRQTQAPKGAWVSPDDSTKLGFREDMFAFVTQLKPGQNASADYSFQRAGVRGPETQTISFSLSWPAGAPPSERTVNGKKFSESEYRLSTSKSSVDGGYWKGFSCNDILSEPDPDPSAPKAPTASASAPPAASFDASKPVLASDVDVPGISPAPPESQWSSTPEVSVPRSTFFGCDTRIIGDWFRMKCSGKVLMTSGEMLSGKRPSQTKLEVADGKLTFVTPYVAGTDSRVALVTSEGKYTFRLSWPAGKPHPDPVAKFESR